MPFFNIDTRAWPNVRISFTSLPSSDAEFQSFLTQMTELYSKKQRFSFLFDTRGFAGLLPHSYIQGLAKWIDTNGDNAKQYLERSAVLIANPAVRLFLNALFLIRKPSAPCQLCSSLRDCVDYLGWMKKK